MESMHLRQMRLHSPRAPTNVDPSRLENHPTAPAILLLLWLSSGVWRAWQASKEGRKEECVLPLFIYRFVQREEEGEYPWATYPSRKQVVPLGYVCTCTSI